MENRQIRKRAWQLFKSHYWQIGLWTLFIAMLSQVAEMFMPNTQENTIFFIRSNVTLLHILFIPVTSFGFYRYLARIWAEESASASDLFFFCSSPRRFGKAILVGLTEILATLLMMLPAVGVAMLSGIIIAAAQARPGVTIAMALTGTIVILALVGVFILSIWLVCRLAFVNVVFACCPDDGPVKVVKKAFRISKGSVGRYIGMNFMTQWWVIIITGIAGGSVLGNLFTNLTGGNANIMSTTVAFILALFYVGYTHLAHCGLGYELLHSTEEPKEPEEPEEPEEPKELEASEAPEVSEEPEASEE